MTRQSQPQPRRGRGDQYGQQTGGQEADSQQTTGQGGRQLSGRGGSQGRQSGMQGQTHSFEDHMTDELRIVLEDFSELSHVAAWCATECAAGEPELGTCARICQDIAEIAALNEMLITRDSMFGPEVADMFVRVATEGLPELRRYQRQHPHILETIATLERTMNSCETVLQQVGGGSRMNGQQSGGQPGGQRSGGQTSGQQMGGQQMSGQQTGSRMGGQPTGGPEPRDRQY